MSNHKKYEVMAIIQNDRTAAEAKKFAETEISGKIKSLKGKILFEDFWGERGFAYRIKDMKWGYYFVAQFDADPDAIKTLTKDWNITKGLVRFLITMVDKKAPDPVSYEDMQKNWETKKKEQEIEDDIKSIETGKKATMPAPAAPKPTPKPDEKPAEKAPAKPTKDDVDKTLEAIIDDATADL